MINPVDELTGNWDYATLPATIALGEGCWVERRDCFKACRTTQRPGLRVGARTRIYTWCAFNLEPAARVTIGKDCLLTGAVLMCSDQITIGDRVQISYNATIADSDFHPIDPDQRIVDAIANRPSGDRSGRPRIPTAPVVIEDDVIIGLATIILKGVRVGRGARVMPGALVTHDVPPGATVGGNPASIVNPPETQP